MLLCIMVPRIGSTWLWQANASIGATGVHSAVAAAKVGEMLVSCQDAKHGSDCYRDVKYAMKHIKQHPDWYVGLHATDNFKTFQHFLHHQRGHGGKRRCPMPCGFRAQHLANADSSSRSGKCHDAEPGEDCYNHMTYTKKLDLPKHPEWFPGLDEDADLPSIQAFLHHQDVCPKPCAKPKVHKTNKEKQGNTEKTLKCRGLPQNKKIQCEKELERGMDGAECKDAEAGEPCFNDVLYAMKTLKQGIHLEWYPGLQADATFPEVQAYLHNQKSESSGDARCPNPCDNTAVKSVKDIDLKGCHTATPDTDVDCYESVLWVISTGINKHPDWYPNVSAADTFESVQDRLARDPKGRCHTMHPCPCATARQGDKCCNAVLWVMSVGIYDHSDWYKGLTNESTFEEVQVRLHNDHHTHCELPCIFAPWWKKPSATAETLKHGDPNAANAANTEMGAANPATR
jgi:hypothetical protein